MAYKRVDKYVIAHSNKQSVLRCLIEKGPINQSAIAQEVGITIPSVMKIMDSLVEAGLVCSTGKGVSSGGKPPEMMDIVSNTKFAVGVDIGLSETRLILTDLKKKEIGTFVGSSLMGLPAEDLINNLCQYILDLINNSHIEKERILGVGIGAPGLIDSDKGTIIFSPHLELVNFDLQKELNKRLNLPIYVENVTRNSARAEHDLGAGKGAQYVFYINLGRGIASSFIIDGEVYSGSHGRCGEIGHITVNREGPLCRCGNYGCLEVMASGEAIAQQARDVVSRNVNTKMLELADGCPEKIDAKIVFEASEMGDSPARIITERAIDYIGIAIAGIINIFDVDCIIIGGGLSRNGKAFWDSLRQSVARHVMKGRNQSIEIVPSQLQDKSSSIGAICCVIDNFIKDM